MKTSATTGKDAGAPYLSVENVTMRFGAFTAVSGVSFTAKAGEFISVLGPSGCGKTTILRIIAGLEIATEGQVCINGADVTGWPVSRRNVGIVFQNYALFPNLSAGKNVAYGLTGKISRGEALRKKVNELLDLVGLSGMGRKYPAQLSGGQQQRVALARAMALSPDLLLLDEPLSALDAKVRVMLRSEIRQLQQRLGVTTIMVTHDQEEALTMADRILVIDKGMLVQNGTPNDIYDHPATPFVASFIGSMNFIEDAEKVDCGRYRAGGREFSVSAENGCGALPTGEKAVIAIRPEDVMFARDDASGPNTVSARVRDLEYRGPLFRVRLTLPLSNGRDADIDADVPTEKVRRLDIRVDKTLSVDLPTDRIRVYAQAGSAA